MMRWVIDLDDDLGDLFPPSATTRSLPPFSPGVVVAPAPAPAGTPAAAGPPPPTPPLPLPLLPPARKHSNKSATAKRPRATTVHKGGQRHRNHHQQHHHHHTQATATATAAAGPAPVVVGVPTKMKKRTKKKPSRAPTTAPTTTTTTTTSSSTGGGGGAVPEGPGHVGIGTGIGGGDGSGNGNVGRGKGLGLGTGTGMGMRAATGVHVVGMPPPITKNPDKSLIAKFEEKFPSLVGATDCPKCCTIRMYTIHTYEGISNCPYRHMKEGGWTKWNDCMLWMCGCCSQEQCPAKHDITHHNVLAARACFFPRQDSDPEMVPTSVLEAEVSSKHKTATLGQGKYSSVFKIKYNGKDVALKVWKRPTEDFWNEVAMFRKIGKHKNIVEFMGFYDAPKTHCIAMAAYRQTLLEYVESRPSSSPHTIVTNAIQIAKQIAKALEWIHSLGLVHQDLKPENCGITKMPSGERLVVIGDFGTVAWRNQTYGRCGTVTWSAPETFSGEHNVDPKSDIFSFGLILWYLVSDTAEFPTTGISSRHLAASSTSPYNSYQPHIPSYAPKQCAQLLKSCWSKQLAHRPDAGGVMRALGAIEKEVAETKKMAARRERMKKKALEKLEYMPGEKTERKRKQAPAFPEITRKEEDTPTEDEECYIQPPPQLPINPSLPATPSRIYNLPSNRVSSPQQPISPQTQAVPTQAITAPNTAPPPTIWIDDDDDDTEDEQEEESIPIPAQPKKRRVGCILADVGGVLGLRIVPQSRPPSPPKKATIPKPTTLITQTQPQIPQPQPQILIPQSLPPSLPIPVPIQIQPELQQFPSPAPATTHKHSHKKKHQVKQSKTRRITTSTTTTTIIEEGE